MAKTKFGVCSTCHAQGIPVSPLSDAALAQEAKRGGCDNTVEYLEVFGEKHGFNMAEHNGPHGRRCDGSGNLPQEIYDV